MWLHVQEPRLADKKGSLCQDRRRERRPGLRTESRPARHGREATVGMLTQTHIPDAVVTARS